MFADHTRILLCQEQECAWQLPNTASQWHFTPASLQKQEVWQWQNETGENLSLHGQLILGNTYRDFYDPLLRLKISRLENGQAQTLLDGNLRWLAQLTPTLNETLQASASCQLQLDFYHSEIDFLLGQKIKNSNFNYSWRLTIEAARVTSATSEAQLQPESGASAGGEILPLSPPAPEETVVAETFNHSAQSSATEIADNTANLAQVIAVWRTAGGFDHTGTSVVPPPASPHATEETSAVLGEATAATLLNSPSTANSAASVHFFCGCWLILLLGLLCWWCLATKKSRKKTN